MVAVSDKIYEGAIAFLRRQYSTIGILAVVTAIIIGTLIALFDRYIEVSGVTPLQSGIETAVAFLVGALLSSIAGIVAMWAAVKSNSRVASAARNGVDEALTVALRGGAVSGIVVVALSLLGVWGLFLVYGLFHEELADAPFLIIGLAFGASFVALFAQLGAAFLPKQPILALIWLGKLKPGFQKTIPVILLS